MRWVDKDILLNALFMTTEPLIWDGRESKMHENSLTYVP